MSRIYGFHRFGPHSDVTSPALSSSTPPMVFNEDRSIAVVADAHIDNVDPLMAELRARGHQMLASGPAEVIAHLYEEYGPDCVKRLRGAFAFALWDERRKIILLARDRLGIRPLYYSFVGGAVVFASKIRSILSYPGIKKDLQRDILPLYFTFLALPPPYTFFKGIEKMAPATTLQIRADGSSLKTEYWNLLADSQQGAFRTDKACADNLIGVLEDVVRIQSKTGVSGGCFLSGGVDSSLITGLASKHNKSLRTFTTGFSGDERSNEFPFARKIAGLFSTQHQERVIDKDHFREEFFRHLLSFQEEPILRPGCISYYLLSKAAREAGCDFVFVGEGGDELFGYPSWKNLVSLKHGLDIFSRLPLFVQRSAMDFFWKKERTGFAYEMLRRNRDRQTIFWGGCNLFYPADIDWLLSGVSGQWNRGIDPYMAISPLAEDFLVSPYRDDYGVFLTYVDLCFKMPESFLMWFDRMSGAHDLNVRFPYLDHVFVEFVVGRCGRFNRKKGVAKYFLKKAAERMVHKECLYRKKQGWGQGAWEWYFKGVIDFAAMRKVIEAFIWRYGYFNNKYIDWLFLNSHLRRQQNKIWQIYVFVLWLEEWLEY